MNSLDAVEVVLKQVSKPLHYRDITECILEQNLWLTEGKTPAATIGARLYSDVRDHGAESRFQLTEPGVFALRAWALEEYEPNSPVERAGDALSFSDATEKVLQEYGEGQPMHYREITDIALGNDWLHTEGKTPEATLYSVVLQEIGRYKKRGETPRFVKRGQGYIGLTAWLPTGLLRRIENHNRKVRQELLTQLKEMDPAEFEELIGRLLIALNFKDVEVTDYSGDGGIDVRGTMVVGDVIATKMAIQVKRYARHNIQSPDIQRVRGSLGSHEQGLIITTSDFSSGARAEAKRPDATPVALMNGEQLVALLMEHDIGVHHTEAVLFELGEEEDE